MTVAINFELNASVTLCVFSVNLCVTKYLYEELTQRNTEKTLRTTEEN